MANETQPLELMGMPGSPYTRKMLALMRYRNIPYRLEFQQRGEEKNADPQRPRFRKRPKARVPLLPTYYLPDESLADDGLPENSGEVVATTDSTPLIRRFEREYEGRSVLPAEPAMRWLDALLEDYADEWLTKAMFHYRWAYPADIEKAGQVLPRWGNICHTEEEIRPIAEFIRNRQIGRLSYVGSNEITRQTIEDSFKRFLQLLDAHLTQYPFLMGHRPGSSDFATYGQLTCLALFDPTPAALVLQNAPRIYAWVESMEDLSGYLCYEQDWLKAADLPPTLCAILREVGQIYLPYLVANAEAVASGAEQVQTEIDGRPWTQNPFPYQAKCLQQLRQQATELDESDRKVLEQALGEDALQHLRVD